jgi:hypothetical protein
MSFIILGEEAPSTFLILYFWRLTGKNYRGFHARLGEWGRQSRAGNIVLYLPDRGARPRLGVLSQDNIKACLAQIAIAH